MVHINRFKHCQAFGRMDLSDTKLRGLLAIWLMKMTLLLMSASGEIVVPNLPSKQYIQEGDLNLGGIFPISSYSTTMPCGSKLRSLGIVQFVEAMVYAIETINNNTSILPGIKLGYAILDSCLKDTTALAQALHFVPRNGSQYTDYNSLGTTLGGYRTNFDVVGVVGPLKSSSSIQVSSLLNLFQIPQISYSSTSDSLSDKNRYPYFLRTVPPDNFQVKAMVDLLRYFNWTYISAVYQEGDYGEMGLKTLRTYAKQYGICLAVDLSVRQGWEPEEDDAVVRQLLRYKKARVVLLFSGPDLARQIFAAVERLNATETFQWVGSEAWANRLTLLGDQMYVAKGAITARASITYVSAFNQYFQGLNPINKQQNPWFDEFWEVYFKCSWSGSSGKRCDPNDVITNSNGFVSLVNIAPIIDAVNTFARGLHDFITRICPGKTGKDLRQCVGGVYFLEALKATTFIGEQGEIKFDENGDFLGKYDIDQLQEVNEPSFTQVKMATWDASADGLTFENEEFVWNIADLDIPEQGYLESVCSKPCKPGEFKIQKELICCWECRACRTNEITSNNATTCVECPEFMWPNQNTFTTCHPIEANYIHWTDPLGLLLVLMTCLGICGSLSIFLFFLKHNKHRLIKASSRELIYLMLFGIILGYVTAIVFVAEPFNSVCYGQYFGFCFSFSWIYSPLLTRTNRIFRIFDAGKKSKERPILISPRSQVLISVAMILVQIVISILTSIFTPPTALRTMPVKTEKFVELTCNMPMEGLISFLAYNILLVIFCIYYAFKTRKLPDNFNESRFISMCVYTTLVIWCAFVPTYFTTGKAYYKAILLSLALILNDTVVLAFLYMPKVYAVLYVDQSSIRTTNMNPAMSVGSTVGTNFTKSTGVTSTIHVAEASTSNAVVRLASPRKNELSVPVDTISKQL